MKIEVTESFQLGTTVLLQARLDALVESVQEAYYQLEHTHGEVVTITVSLSTRKQIVLNGLNKSYGG